MDDRLGNARLSSRPNDRLDCFASLMNKSPWPDRSDRVLVLYIEPIDISEIVIGFCCIGESYTLLYA